MKSKLYVLLSNNVMPVVLLLLSFCLTNLVGQNLVVNGDFEKYEECPTQEGNWEGYATGWSTIFGTPDYLNCLYYGNNPSITPNAHSGVGLALGVWFDTDYAIPPVVKREYMIGSLQLPLIEEEYYYVFFWIYNYKGGVQIRSQHVGLIEPGQYDSIGEYSIRTDIAIENTDWLQGGRWHKISGCYTAKGGESQIVLGNFLTNEQTEYVDTSISFSNVNFIDDVGVYAVSSLIPEDTILWVGQNYVFDTTIQQSYEVNGVLIEGGEQVFDQTGIYNVDVLLDGCGYVGSFKIEVIDCDIYLSNLTYNTLPDSTYCYTEGLNLDLPPYPDVQYFKNSEVISGATVELDKIGVDTILMSHRICGTMQEAICLGIDCDTIDYVEGKECFYIPNVFSPNGDGINDEFKVLGSCSILNYKMEVYDRWGSLVFQSTDPQKTWDGRWRQTLCQAGVYLYVSEIQFAKDSFISKEEKKGTVTLIR